MDMGTTLWNWNPKGMTVGGSGGVLEGLVPASQNSPPKLWNPLRIEREYPGAL